MTPARVSSWVRIVRIAETNGTTSPSSQGEQHAEITHRDRI